MGIAVEGGNSRQGLGDTSGRLGETFGYRQLENAGVAVGGESRENN